MFLADAYSSAIITVLEHDNWAALRRFMSGFIQAYATELGIDPDPIVEAWRAAGGDRRQALSIGDALASRKSKPRARAVWELLRAYGWCCRLSDLAVWRLGGGKLLGDNGDAGIEVP